MTYCILAPDDPALQAFTRALAAQPDSPLTIEIVPWADYRDRLLTALQAPVASHAAVCVPGHVWLPELAAQGWLVPLNELARSLPEATAAYNPDDLLPLVARESRFEGQWFQLPIFSDGHILFYRADCVTLPETGPNVPTVSVHDLAGLAEAAHNPPHLYGLALKAHPSEIFLDWLPFLWEAGVPLLDHKDEPAFNTAEGIAALEAYCSLRAWCPPDTHTYGNAEIAAVIRQGRAALVTTWGGQAAPIFLGNDDPVANTYRAAVFPRPWNATWGIALPHNLPQEERPRVLQELMALTGPRQDQAVITAAGSPVRTSSYTAEALERFPWLPAQKAMLERATLLPVRPELGQFLGALYEAVYAAFIGEKSPAQALNDAAHAVRETLRNAKAGTHE